MYGLPPDPTTADVVQLLAGEARLEGGEAVTAHVGVYGVVASTSDWVTSNFDRWFQRLEHTGRDISYDIRTLLVVGALAMSGGHQRGLQLGH